MIPRSRLIIDSTRSPSVGTGEGRRADQEPLPDGTVQQGRQADRAAQEAEERGAAEPLRGLLGADRRGHQMAPDRDASGVTAHVAAHRQDQEQQCAPWAVGWGQHEADETGRQRQVRKGEGPGGNVPQIAIGPAGHPPGEDRGHSERDAGQRGALPLPVGQGERHGATHGHRNHRYPDLPLRDGAGQFPQSNADHRTAPICAILHVRQRSLWRSTMATNWENCYENGSAIPR